MQSQRRIENERARQVLHSIQTPNALIHGLTKLATPGINYGKRQEGPHKVLSGHTVPTEHVPNATHSPYTLLPTYLFMHLETANQLDYNYTLNLPGKLDNIVRVLLREVHIVFAAAPPPAAMRQIEIQCDALINMAYPAHTSVIVHFEFNAANAFADKIFDWDFVTLHNLSANGTLNETFQIRIMGGTAGTFEAPIYESIHLVWELERLHYY